MKKQFVASLNKLSSKILKTGMLLLLLVYRKTVKPFIREHHCYICNHTRHNFSISKAYKDNV